MSVLNNFWLSVKTRIKFLFMGDKYVRNLELDLMDMNDINHALQISLANTQNQVEQNHNNGILMAGALLLHNSGEAHISKELVDMALEMSQNGTLRIDVVNNEDGSCTLTLLEDEDNDDSGDVLENE